MASNGIKIPVYQCHKEVCALEIIEVSSLKDSGMLLHFEAPYAAQPVTHEWNHKHKPEAGGYWVRYEDGYTSFSPGKVFESGYTLITNA